MMPLPPVAPVTGWLTHARLPRDHYVRLDSNDYSVHPAAVGWRIEVVADLARVRVWCAGRLLADHDRIWAKHQTISDPEHVAAAKAMRRNRFDIAKLPIHVEVEQRSLTDYDALIDIGGPVA
jgi:transposase